MSLTRFEVNFCHHTARRASAVGFDGCQSGVEDSVVEPEAVDLAGVEGVVGPGGHDQQPFTPDIMYLEHIAGKAVHLLQADGDQLFSGVADPVDEVFALCRDEQ